MYLLHGENITCGYDAVNILSDCTVGVDIGDKIVVERRMISEVKAMGETNYLVLENYVYGRLQDE